MHITAESHPYHTHSMASWLIRVITFEKQGQFVFKCELTFFSVSPGRPYKIYSVLSWVPEHSKKPYFLGSSEKHLCYFYYFYYMSCVVALFSPPWNILPERALGDVLPHPSTLGTRGWAPLCLSLLSNIFPRTTLPPVSNTMPTLLYGRPSWWNFC